MSDNTIHGYTLEEVIKANPAEAVRVLLEIGALVQCGLWCGHVEPLTEACGVWDMGEGCGWHNNLEPVYRLREANDEPANG